MPAGPDGRAGITAALVRRLVAEQLPAWAGLPVTPVRTDGWDNRTYRLGAAWTVRLPTAAGYVAAVAKEDRWLPVLAPQLPVPAPVPVATGRPGCGYPHPWSVRRWIPGHTVAGSPLGDPTTFGVDVARFLGALRTIDATGGPRPGPHCFHRGGPPGHYDDEVREALRTLGSDVDGTCCAAVWSEALATTWSAPPVWFHGDIAPGNLLVDASGRLAAVLDFGTCGVGDPACDLVLAWTVLRGRAREAFRKAVELDDATWARARGWALWKALIMLVAEGPGAAGPRAVVEEVLGDHVARP